MSLPKRAPDAGTRYRENSDAKRSIPASCAVNPRMAVLPVSRFVLVYAASWRFAALMSRANTELAHERSGRR